MHSSIYWIDLPTPKRLGIMARPRSGEWLVDEVRSWKEEGVSLVVSLLESSEIWQLSLATEPVHCAEMGIEFLSFPIPDRGVPESYRRTLDLVKIIAAASLQGNAAIHCRAGIGRSSLIAASVVVSLGFDSDHAFEMIQAARGLPVPDTVQQRVWVSSFEDWLRAYDGDLPST